MHIRVKRVIRVQIYLILVSVTKLQISGLALMSAYSILAVHANIH